MLVSRVDLIKKAYDLLCDENPVGYDERLNQAEKIIHLVYNGELHEEGLEHSCWWNLSIIHMRRGNFGLAANLLRQCLAKTPDFIEAINNIGYLYKQQDQREKAKEYFDRLLKLIEKPDIKIDDKARSEFLTNMGAVYIANGTPKEGLKWFERALKINPENPEAKWNSALSHLEQGDYVNGFKYYDCGSRTERTKDRKYTEKETPVWNGEKGQTVCVYGEQGIGDEIMFASIIGDLKKDCRVIIDAHPRLADLFRLSFPGTPVYGTRKTSTPLPWAKLHKVDYKISMGSLGKFYRQKKEDFPGTPYMIADLQLIDKYARKLEALGDKPKIGISWKGGTILTNEKHRIIPMDLLKELLSLDADFISLQYNKGMSAEIEEFQKANQNIVIHHWQDAIDDYDETAALVSNLDLIISVPQSVVHLAGALGKTTWQLCPKKALWQMGVYGEDMSWYSCVRNFWQGDDHQWEPVIKQVKEELCRLLAKSTQS